MDQRAWGRLRPVATAPRAVVERRSLPRGTAGQRVRWLGQDVVQIDHRVPEGRVDRVVGHLLTGHGGPTYADAFGVVVCDGACPSSAAWFAQAVDSATIG